MVLVSLLLFEINKQIKKNNLTDFCSFFQDIVERFPMELIREPTAFTSDDPKELYNNIFIFIVAEDPKQKYNNTTEMHIFQVIILFCFQYVFIFMEVPFA